MAGGERRNSFPPRFFGPHPEYAIRRVNTPDPLRHLLDSETWTRTAERRPRCPDALARTKGFFDRHGPRHGRGQHDFSGHPATILRNHTIKTAIIVGIATEDAALRNVYKFFT